MRIEILDEMSKDELIEYCVALNDSLYRLDKVNETQNHIIECYRRLTQHNAYLLELLAEYGNTINELKNIEYDLTNTYMGHIKPAKVKSYRKSDTLDIEVMDLDNDPDTDKKPEPKLELDNKEG